MQWFMCASVLSLCKYVQMQCTFVFVLCVYVGVCVCLYVCECTFTISQTLYLIAGGGKGLIVGIHITLDREETYFQYTVYRGLFYVFNQCTQIYI